MVSLDRVDRVLELQAENSNGLEALVDEPLGVEVDDLVVALDGHRILDGVNLRVAAGETVALVGSTGTFAIGLAASFIWPREDPS